jgi:shikimate kinase
MGSGKTSFGKKLAKLLQVPFIDTDREITRKHGPIPELFANQGENYFRELETAALESALKEGCVVATGGGAVVREVNHALLQGAYVIYLRTNFEAVAGRLDTERRPLLAKDPDAWRKIFEERKHLYEGLADAVVDTAGRHADTVLADLANLAGGVN